MMKEEYIVPLVKTVNLRSERVICQSPVNLTESLNEENFDW